MSKLLSFRRPKQMRSSRSGRKSICSRNNSRSSSRCKLPQTTDAANVFQRLSLVNPLGMAMLVNLGRKMLAETDIINSLGL